MKTPQMYWRATSSVVRRAVRRVVPALAWASCLGLPAASMVVFTDVQPVTVGTWSKTLAVPRFNLPGAVLTAVQFELSGEIHGSLALENTSFGGVVSSPYVLVSRMVVKRPDNSEILFINPSFSTILNLGPNTTWEHQDLAETVDNPHYDPTHVFGDPPSGTVIPNISASGSALQTLPPPAGDLSLFTGSGTVALTFAKTGETSGQGGGNYDLSLQVSSSASLKVTYVYDVLEPGLKLAKTASTLTLEPFEPCTYTYTVENTGGVPLTDVTVRDDNGTPAYPDDDFVVGTIATLAPGETRTLMATTIPPICTKGPLSTTGVVVPTGTIIPVILPNGDVKVTYLQDFGINDNTYGTGSVGWVSTRHAFGNLTGSDKLEFRFYDKNGSVVIDFYLDTISQIGSVTYGSPATTITYPSGYGTSGPFGNEGKMISGDPNNLVTFWTSISESLNRAGNLPFKASLIVNSPTYDNGSGQALVDLSKAPAGWNPINIYSATIKASAFPTGFWKVTIPDQHNSPAKQGGHIVVPDPDPCDVVNTASAVDASATVSATAQATVHVGATTGPSMWVDTDVGNVGKAGGVQVVGSEPTLQGAGSGIGGGDDAFNFYHMGRTGDCTIVARVLTQGNTDRNAQAGVMIRESTNKKSKFVGVFVTPSNGVHMEQRGGSGSPSKAGVAAPCWLRVVRSGNTFTTAYSTDNVSWKVLGSTTVNMSAEVRVGLAVSSHSDRNLSLASFDEVTVSP